MALHPNEQQRQQETEHPISNKNGSTPFVEDEELASLLSKEQDQNLQNATLLMASFEKDSALFLARTEAIEWLLKVHSFHGFSSVTALLAINYLDRILISPNFQRNKPWMLQLLAVTCISLAAKVEEVHVPLLLDLQVEDCKYIFEAKTIQRMELLVLSVLQWKMNPVTCVSFLAIFNTKGIFGFKNQSFLKEFFWRCEQILLSLVSDCRSVRFVPSVMAVSAMVMVVEEMGDCNCNLLDFQDRLLNAFKITKERVKECRNVIAEIAKRQTKPNRSGKKRKQHVMEEEEEISRTSSESESEIGSPNGVIEANFSCESSNDSWSVGTTVHLSAADQTSCSSKRTKSTH